MHPGLKIFTFVCLLITSFLPNGFFGLLILYVWIFLIFILSKKSLKSVFKLLFWVTVLISVLFIIDWFTYRWQNEITSINTSAILWGHLSGNYYLYDGQLTYDLFSFGKNQWYELNIYTVIIISYVYLKILVVIMIVQILVSNTDNVDMTNGFNSLLKPINALKIPTASISLIFALTLKFIPMLYDEAKMIRLAQKSRGALLNKKAILSKLKNYISLIPPLFATSFRNAEIISDAMLIKGFTLANKKNYFYKYKFHLFDILVAIISLSICILLIYMLYNHIFFAPFGIANSIIINSISSL